MSEAGFDVNEVSIEMIEDAVGKLQGQPYVRGWTYDWAMAGPIIEREKIDVMWSGDRWSAYCMTPDGEQQLVAEGETPLIAAMRCYVASKLNKGESDEAE